jgi:hypothetical protein
MSEIGFSRGFWLSIRQAFLMMVDAIERELGISPRTSELRKADKNPERS